MSPSLVSWFISTVLHDCLAKSSLPLHEAGARDWVLSSARAAPLYLGCISNLLLAIKALSITLQSFLRWAFTTVSVNITDKIFIVIFPLLLIIWGLLLQAQRLFLAESFRSACVTGQPIPLSPIGPEELHHSPNPSSLYIPSTGSSVSPGKHHYLHCDYVQFCSFCPMLS